MYNRCRPLPEPEGEYWPIYEKYANRVCGGTFMCDADSVCVNPADTSKATLAED